VLPATTSNATQPAAGGFVAGFLLGRQLLMRSDDFLAATLPATEPGFTFDAFLEFAYLSDYWQQPKARVFNRDPLGARKKVEQDIKKIAAHLAAGACRLGYVIVFEECDHDFSKTFPPDTEAKFGCRVRFIRGYS
jgi:hypothetical protein